MHGDQTRTDPFPTPNLGYTPSPWQDKTVPGQRDLAGGHDGTVPLLQHKPGRDKIISNRWKQSDYQRPSPAPDLLSLSAASFLRNTAAVSQRLQAGGAELSPQPGQPPERFGGAEGDGGHPRGSGSSR